jgi:hypothetical protein
MAKVVSIFSRKKRVDRRCAAPANRQPHPAKRRAEESPDFVWYAIRHAHGRGCIIEVFLVCGSHLPSFECLRGLKVVIRSPGMKAWEAKTAALLSVSEADSEEDWLVVRFITEARPSFRLKSLRQTTFSVVMPHGATLTATAEVFLEPVDA